MRFRYILIAATVGAGALWYASRTGGAMTDTAPSAPALPPAASSVAPAPTPPPGRQGASAPASALPAVAANDASAPRLEDHLAILGTMDDPMMALSGFQIIELCIAFQHNAAHHIDEKTGMKRPLTELARREQAAYCAHLTETMKRDRLVYLEKAVKGGAMGAALAFFQTGPFGDPSALITRPDDPLVQEWKQQAGGYLTQAAHSGDMGAMMVIYNSDSAQDMPGISPVLQHAAGIAIMRIMTTARNEPSGANPFDEAQVQPPTTLGQDQLALARSMADDLVAAHQARKERDGSRTFVREQAAAVTGR